jgi:hypothetical protein
MGWYFLWGPFRGGIFFGVRSEGIFLCLSHRKRSKRFGLPLSDLEFGVTTERVNWPVCLSNQALRRQDVWRSGYIDPRILDLDTSW